MVEYNKFFVWICLLGSEDEAKRYSCDYSMKNAKNDETFHYIGPVHTYDKIYYEIVDSAFLFGIMKSVAERSANNDKKLEIEITIRNLEEETRDEEMESSI